MKHQLQIFTEAGYKVKAQILNASHYGVPQARKRIFIVRIKDEFNTEYRFPSPIYGDDLQPYRTIRDAIAHLPEWPLGEFYDTNFHWYYMSRNRRQDWVQISNTIVANPRHMPLHPVSPAMEKIDTDKWFFLQTGLLGDSATKRLHFYRVLILHISRNEKFINEYEVHRCWQCSPAPII